MLEKRAKKEFNKWMSKKHKASGYHQNIYNKFSFEWQPESVKYILLVDWFCSVGVPIGIAPEYHDNTGEHLGFYPVIRDTIFWKANEDGYFKDLEEARKTLIREAMNIYNQEVSWIKFKEQKGYE